MHGWAKVGVGCSVQNPKPVARARGRGELDGFDQFEDVLALQEVALEAETSWDDTEATAQDAIVWGGTSAGAATPSRRPASHR